MKRIDERSALVIKRGVLVHQGRALGDLTQAVRAHRTERIRKLSHVKAARRRARRTVDGSNR